MLELGITVLFGVLAGFFLGVATNELDWRMAARLGIFRRSGKRVYAAKRFPELEGK